MGQIKHIPIIGTRYGQWEVISTEIKRHSERNSRTAYFKVKCKCGREGWRAVHTLIGSITRSCKSCCKTANDINTFILSYFKNVQLRAKKSNFDINIDAKYIQELYDSQNRKCAISGLEIVFRPNWLKTETTASLDRIDNSKGYIKGNVQWLHKDINNMKHTHTEEYFKSLCKLVSSKCG